MKSKILKFGGITLLAAVVCLSAGCASAPVRVQHNTPPPKPSLTPDHESIRRVETMPRVAGEDESEIIIVRPSKHFGHGVNIRVYVNDRARLDIAAGQSAAIVVPNGRHRIYAEHGLRWSRPQLRFMKSREITVDAGSNRVIFETSFSAGEGLFAPPNVVLEKITQTPPQGSPQFSQNDLRGAAGFVDPGAQWQTTEPTHTAISPAAQGAHSTDAATAPRHASWNYFPPKNAGESEIKFGYSYWTQDRYWIYSEPVTHSSTSLRLAARHSFTNRLEGLLVLPIPMSYSYSFYGERVNEERYVGLSHPIIGIRYWPSANAGFFLDVHLPIDTRDGAEPTAELQLGAQFSADFTEALSFGSQIGLVIPFPYEDESYTYHYGMDVTVGAELNYTIGIVTPYVGLDMLFGITESRMEYDWWNEPETYDPNPFGMNLRLGTLLKISDMINFDAALRLDFGERYIRKDSEDSVPMTISGGLSLHF